MIYCDEDKYKNSVVLDDKMIKRLESKLSIRCLYGGLIGSRIYLGGGNGDYDLGIRFIGNSYEHFNEGISSNLDIHGFSLNAESLQRLTGCISHKIEFPTFYTAYRRMPEDDKCIELFRIFSSDYIWDSGYLVSHIEEILREISPLIIFDYLFSRVAGNLETYISNGFISDKRFIRMMYNINSMLWMLEKRSYPYLNISQMVEHYQCGVVKSFVLELIQKRSICSKYRKTINVNLDKRVETYIKVIMKEIAKEIREIDPNVFFIDLDKSSFLGKIVHRENI